MNLYDMSALLTGALLVSLAIQFEFKQYISSISLLEMLVIYTRQGVTKNIWWDGWMEIFLSQNFFSLVIDELKCAKDCIIQVYFYIFHRGGV